MPTRLHLNIGSNIGDRTAHIERAVALITERLRPADIRISHPVESEPWGYDSSNTFINIGVDITIPGEISGDSDAIALLHTLKDIEREISPDAHRNPDGTYRDRAIDIDIILIDGITVDTPQLTVPHPLMHRRQFVMQPLMQLRPDYNDSPTISNGKAR